MYPVRDGIGVFLTPDPMRPDVWDAGNGLVGWLRARPDAERRLMDVVVEMLNPADRLLRAFVLEERGDFAEADAIARSAMRDLYTEEYRRCWERQMRWVLDRLAGAPGPIIDIASGRCYLVEELARELAAPIVASDVNPRVLRRDRGRLQHLGLYDRVSLLAFDARQSPFRPAAVTTMTSNLGPANVDHPGPLADELRRVLSGTLFSISCFYPEDESPNARAIRAMGAEASLFRRPALAYLERAGLHADVENRCTGIAHPLQPSDVTGAPVDLLPVAETVLEWCVLVIR